MFDELPAAGLVVHAGENTGIRRRIDDPIGGRQRVDITRAADICVAYIYAWSAQGEPAFFAAWSNEIIKAETLRSIQVFADFPRDGASRESANAGDQYTHGMARRWLTVER